MLDFEPEHALSPVILSEALKLGLLLEHVDAGQLDPGCLLLLSGKLSWQNIDGFTPVNYQNVVGDVPLQNLVDKEPEHKTQRVGNLRLIRLWI